MNYQKILIGAVILVIIIAVIWYFVNASKRKKEDELLRQAQLTYNQQTGNSPEQPLPSVSEITNGNSIKAKYDDVKVYDTYNDLSIFKVANKGVWIGTIKGSYADNFYEISTPSRASGLIVAKILVEKV